MNKNTFSTILLIWLLITSGLGLYSRFFPESFATEFHTRWGMLTYPILVFFIVDYIKRTTLTRQQIYSLYAIVACGVMAWLTGLAHNMEFLPLSLHQFFVIIFALLVMKWLFQSVKHES